MTLAGVALLASAFAVGGLIALRRHEAILCNCLGSGRGGYLGRRQLAALPVWLAAVALVWQGRQTPPPPSDGAAFLAALGLSLAAIRAFETLGAWREASGDRRSAAEMYGWLR